MLHLSWLCSVWLSGEPCLTGPAILTQRRCSGCQARGTVLSKCERVSQPPSPQDGAGEGRWVGTYWDSTGGGGTRGPWDEETREGRTAWQKRTEDHRGEGRRGEHWPPWVQVGRARQGYVQAQARH